MFCAGESGSVEVVDLKTRKQEPIIRVSRAPLFALALSADGKCLAVAGQDASVHLLDPDTGKEVQKLKGHHDCIYSLGFSQDGKSLLSGSGDCTVRLWQVGTGKELSCFEGHTGAPSTRPGSAAMAGLSSRPKLRAR